ncbi:MAG: glycosyltransferase family A protein [Polaromonas sp.]|nr:glycosyltransferase family A protein [Polaromonas sp.]
MILPLYNGESYLHAAVDSVLTQSFSLFELIIINDGSRDGSGDIVRQYADPRIRYLEQSNQGLAATLNRGISLASGKYIARQDQDDLFKPERLQRQVEMMEAHPELALVGTAAEVWEGGVCTDRVLRHPSDGGTLLFESLFDNRFVHSSVMLRRSALLEVGGYSTDSNRQPPEDYELWSRMMRHYRLANLPDVLTGYREVAGSMSRSGVNPFLQTLVKLSSENLAWAAGLPAESADARGLAALYHSAFSLIPSTATRQGMHKVLAAAGRKIMADAPASAAAVAALLRTYSRKLDFRYLDWRLGGAPGRLLRAPILAGARRRLRRS